MVLFRNNNYFLWLSMMIVLCLAIAQVLNSTVAVLLFLVLFGVFAVWGAFKDMAIPLLLFFLPWSPLMKLSPGTMSMYTVALVVVLLIYVLRNIKKISIMHIFPASILFVQTMVVKTVTDDPIDNGYILFFLCLLLFPLIASEKERGYDFFTLVIYFTLGIISAALSAQQLMIFPTISRYITVHTYQSLTRLSGFYGDPNFYAAHITAAVAGILVILLREKNMSRKIVVYILLVVLLYCGFLSVSKSFALIIVCIASLWIIEVLFRRGRISSKLMLLLALAVGGVYILTSMLFTDLVDMMIGRFFGENAGSTISDFTTGRTDLWAAYFREFEKNPLVLIFGSGLTDNLVQNYSSHNIVIQCIYQFGITGTVALAIWMLYYFKNLLRSVKVYLSDITQIIILFCGSFGSWLALDTLLFDEFFLLPFFVAIGIVYIADADKKELSVGNDYEEDDEFE